MTTVSLSRQLKFGLKKKKKKKKGVKETQIFFNVSVVNISMTVTSSNSPMNANLTRIKVSFRILMAFPDSICLSL